MLAVTNTHLATSGNDVDATSFATASISPSKNKLVIVIIHGTVAAGPVTLPVITGCNMVWERVGNVYNAATTAVCCMYRGMSATPVAGALTIDFLGQTQDNCYWSISEFDNVDTSGYNGRNAIVQFASGVNASSLTSTATLAAFSHPNNATVGGGRASGLGTGYSVGAGLTSIGSFQNARFVQSEWAAGNVTAVTWSQTAGNTDMLTVAAEIRCKNQDKRDFRKVHSRRDRFPGSLPRLL